MAAGLKKLRIRARQLPGEAFGLVQAIDGQRGTEAVAPSNDAIAREYLTMLFQAPAVPSMSLTEDPASPAPELRYLDDKKMPMTSHTHVCYQQHHRGVPIYGAVVGVELSRARTLVGIDGDIADPGVDVVPAFSPEDARARVLALDRVADGDAALPTLVIRFDARKQRWALAYLFEHVLFTPKPDQSATPDDAPPPEPYRVFLDAHSGDLIMRVPLIEHVGPVVGVGKDRSGRNHSFGATEVQPGQVALHDGERRIRTCSLGFRSWRAQPSPLPGAVVTSSATTFEQPAAVSAHAHAAVVFDFLRDVLMRNGIDDNGLEIVSSVDCTNSVSNVWRNAAWIRSPHPALPAEVQRGMMVYGQVPDAGGELLSIAEGLDVVGHELMHGVTGYTAGLEYASESGALNESYSDIFGLIIANRSLPLADWDWSIGRVLNADGTPLRDMKDPTTRGQPGHYDDRRRLAEDELPDDTNDHGHVHANSGIHNRAAALLLAGGIFTWEEVARLFYLTLVTPGRLSTTATFADARAGTVATCETLFEDEALEDQQARLAAVAEAFDMVGIGA